MTDYDRIVGLAAEIAKNKADTPRYSKKTGYRVRNRYNYGSLDPSERRWQKGASTVGGAAGLGAGAVAAHVGTHGPGFVDRTAAKLHENKKISLKTRMTAHKIAPYLEHGKQGAVIGAAAGLGALAGSTAGKQSMAAWQNRGTTTKKPVRKSYRDKDSLPPMNTGEGATLGAAGAGLAAHRIAGRGKNPERLADLRASYHNNAHLRATRAYNSQKTGSSLAPGRKGPYGSVRKPEDLSRKAQKLVRTGNRLHTVAATDKMFQGAAPAIAGLGAAAVGGAVGGAISHHRHAEWKKANTSSARIRKDWAARDDG